MHGPDSNDPQTTLVLQTVLVMNLFSTLVPPRTRMLTNIHASNVLERTPTGSPPPIPPGRPPSPPPLPTGPPPPAPPALPSSIYRERSTKLKKSVAATAALPAAPPPPPGGSARISARAIAVQRTTLVERDDADTREEWNEDHAGGEDDVNIPVPSAPLAFMSSTASVVPSLDEEYPSAMLFASFLTFFKIRGSIGDVCDPIPLTSRAPWFARPPPRHAYVFLPRAASHSDADEFMPSNVHEQTPPTQVRPHHAHRHRPRTAVVGHRCCIRSSCCSDGLPDAHRGATHTTT